MSLPHQEWQGCCSGDGRARARASGLGPQGSPALSAGSGAPPQCAHRAHLCIPADLLLVLEPSGLSSFSPCSQASVKPQTDRGQSWGCDPPGRAGSVSWPPSPFLFVFSPCPEAEAARAGLWLVKASASCRCGSLTGWCLVAAEGGLPAPLRGASATQGGSPRPREKTPLSWSALPHSPVCFPHLLGT